MGKQANEPLQRPQRSTGDCILNVGMLCREMLAALPEPVVAARAEDGRVLYANERFYECFRYSEGETANLRLQDFISVEGAGEERWTALPVPGEVETKPSCLVRGPGGVEHAAAISLRRMQHEGEDVVIVAIPLAHRPSRDEELLVHQLGFERLLSDLCTRFSMVTAETIDEEVNHALRVIRTYLQVDRAALLEASNNSKSLSISHVCLRDGVSLPFPIGYDLVPHFPYLAEQILEKGILFCANGPEDHPAEAPVDRRSHEENGILAILNIPVKVGGAVTHVLHVDDCRRRKWPKAFMARVNILARIFANAVCLSRRPESVRLVTGDRPTNMKPPEAEAHVLPPPEDTFRLHHEIMGRSPAIRLLLQQIAEVAPTGTHVLVTGETGTGKELVARAIHAQSSRSDRLLLTVNCAALPATLIESELFGREKGAYTGALSRQMGRFEMADGGTVFLDEVGELPPDLQSKLLRVLQQGEFERVGSPRTIKVNIRVIAATNKDLLHEVNEGKYRADLYYRLSVYPVEVAPLRERREDIPGLVWSFIEEFSALMGKKIDRVDKDSLVALEQYHWPGNVRELRNVVERAMIQCRSPELVIPLPATRATSGDDGDQSLEEVERRHILKVLGRCDWRVKGAGGASAVLKMNPSTLYSRMDKLGIKRP